jgi:hypothetical protein
VDVTTGVLGGGVLVTTLRDEDAEFDDRCVTLLEKFDDAVIEPDKRDDPVIDAVEDDGGDCRGEEAIETRFDALLRVFDALPLIEADALLDDCAKARLIAPSTKSILDAIVPKFRLI